jgi:hypothetical protein
VDSTTNVEPTYNKETGLWGGGKSFGFYGSSLDYIFTNNEAVTNNVFSVKHSGVLMEDYAFFSSDHRAVFADIEFTNAPVKP